MIIAVDGPTASGKGTISKALAAHYGLPWLDTGLLYRAVGRQVALNGGNADNSADAVAACDFPDELLDDPVLRDEATGGLASRVSVHPEVRAALNKRQVDFANQPEGAVLDGRDIGTVIAPHAEVKLFVTASAEIRAERRFKEMQGRGQDVDYETILADIRARDKRDSERADAPLKAAEDAHLLDTGNLTIGAAVQRAIALVDAKIENRPA
ncbi:d(CMP) kinase [Sphingorhabdus sp.]|jgi:cytidylate kinase|uniref:(d)CMP kinase n=1 Tax=Sphingorhabdus sp. TaxID=1902408 RepID=UPI002B58C384|nr:d(CMP) kinase [Sphingorhabdus sp.]HMT41863.1 d(CMP) kinase [Sphingorhabdus sp.]